MTTQSRSDFNKWYNFNMYKEILSFILLLVNKFVCRNFARIIGNFVYKMCGRCLKSQFYCDILCYNEIYQMPKLNEKHFSLLKSAHANRANRKGQYIIFEKR